MSTKLILIPINKEKPHSSLYRLVSLEGAIPFVKPLEDQYLPKVRFEEQLLELLKY